MIDWYIIQYLYPSAMEHFKKTMFPTIGVVSLSILNAYDIKKLYGFFDRQNIFLNVELIIKNSWSYTIYTNKSLVVSKSSNICDRETIEIEGFYECFKMLEGQLNN